MYSCFWLKFLPFMNFISRTLHRILKSFTPKNCKYFSLFLCIFPDFLKPNFRNFKIIIITYCTCIHVHVDLHYFVSFFFAFLYSFSLSLPLLLPPSPPNRSVPPHQWWSCQLPLLVTVLYWHVVCSCYYWEETGTLESWLHSSFPSSRYPRLWLCPLITNGRLPHNNTRALSAVLR